VLAFFKTGCPTCQLSFPVWGELARRYGDAIPVVGVAQDPPAVAGPWLAERGFPGPNVDDSDGYPLSRAFAVDVVPTLVLVDGDGTVAEVGEGWSRDAANAWDERLAAATGRPSPGPVSEDEDGLPAFKPG
jgi:thiol-disulfide isomerase/thioredoxin